MLQAIADINLRLARTIHFYAVAMRRWPSLGGQAKWVERKGGSPREVFQRGKIREILGMGR